MKRDIELEATLVAKYAVVAPVLDERSRRRWAAAESLAIGYGGDAVVSSATGLARETIRKGRREIARDEAPTDRIRRPGGGRPRIQQDQPGIQAALEALVDPLTRGDPTSPLRWTCKSRAKLAAALTEQGWRVSSTTVGRLLHRLGYRLQSPRKRQEGATHPDRNAQFEHINQTSEIPSFYYVNRIGNKSCRDRMSGSSEGLQNSAPELECGPYASTGKPANLIRAMASEA